MIVGRSSSCDIVVDDTTVSRRHAELRLHCSELLVADLGSRNGTFVGGRRIQSSELGVAQTVRFGQVEFEITVAAAVSESETGEPEPEGGGMSVFRDRLSWAEQRVFGPLTKGLPEKEIARRLHLSPHTVHNHTRAIFRAFGVHSRVELLAFLTASKHDSHSEQESEEQQSPGATTKQIE